MKQIGKILCLMLSLAYVSNGFAHAVVTDHTLKIAQPKANQAKKIELTFNSKIELGLSRVFLVSKGDVHTLLPIGPGIKQGNVSIDLPPLIPGEYALRYKIFAADGHLTEDVIHFSVIP